MKNHCYIHACNKTIGLQILKEMIDYLKVSELYSQLNTINICLVGHTHQTIIENLKNYDCKINLCFYNPNPKLFEYPCLNCLWKRCQTEPDCNILYMHTKGANTPYFEAEHEWRKYMQYYLVNNYKICLSKLNSYDNVGCELSNNGHYSGNFWWSTGRYINQLKDPFIYLNETKYYIKESQNVSIPNRFYAELWLLKDYLSTKPKSYNLFRTGASKVKKISKSDYIDSENPRLFYYNQLRKLNIITKKEYCEYVNKNCKYSNELIDNSGSSKQTILPSSEILNNNLNIENNEIIKNDENIKNNQNIENYLNTEDYQSNEDNKTKFLIEGEPKFINTNKSVKII